MSPQQRRQQSRLLRRALMGFGAYACTVVLVLVCYGFGFLPAWVGLSYTLVVLGNNLFFFGIILSGLNLRLRRPDMTMEQILAGVIPGLFTLYFLDNDQARAAFVLLAIVPMTFGILGLSTPRALITSAVIYLAFAAMFVALHLSGRGEDPVGDGILMLAFFFGLAQMSIIGGHIGRLRRDLASSNRELNHALDMIAEMVNRDDLTGLFNRRYLISALEEEVRQERRSDNGLSVALIDVDYFKAVNDEYGHMVGDRVLVAMSKAISQNIRRVDLFGRYGGEEFLLLLPGTGEGEACSKVQALLGKVAALDLSEQGFPKPLTFSAGVTGYRGGEAIAAVLKRADTALYQAKAAGRNRVQIAAPPEAAGGEVLTPAAQSE